MYSETIQVTISNLSSLQSQCKSFDQQNKISTAVSQPGRGGGAVALKIVPFR